MKYTVVIKGIGSLLQHRFNESKLSSPSKKKRDTVMDDEAKREAASQFLYLDKKGTLVQPSNHIEGAMIRAGSQFSFHGKKTYKDLIKAAVVISPEFIPHKNQKWEVDERAVVNPTTRGRTMCYRPRVDGWELKFDMEVMDDRADLAVIKQILEYAGAYVAIGAYRPKFGRFEVTKFQKA